MTRSEKRKQWLRRIELLAVRVRFGRRIGRDQGPRDSCRAWRGWRARYVVVGDTHAEAARRTWRKRWYKAFVHAAGDLEAGLMPVTGGRFYDEPAFIPTAEAEGAAYYLNDPRNTLRMDEAPAAEQRDQEQPALHGREAAPAPLDEGGGSGLGLDRPAPGDEAVLAAPRDEPEPT